MRNPASARNRKKIRFRIEPPPCPFVTFRTDPSFGRADKSYTMYRQPVQRARPDGARGGSNWADFDDWGEVAGSIPPPLSVNGTQWRGGFAPPRKRAAGFMPAVRCSPVTHSGDEPRRSLFYFKGFSSTLRK